MLLNEDGVRPPKQVRTIYFYIKFACSNCRFFKTSSSITLNRVLQIGGHSRSLGSNAAMSTFCLKIYTRPIRSNFQFTVILPTYIIWQACAQFEHAIKDVLIPNHFRLT
jgi:hypothetical protein